MIGIRSFLIMVAACTALGGCDAIESLNEDAGNVSEPQPVAQQLGEVETQSRDLRADAIKEMLIDPPQGTWPQPLPELEWRPSLDAGWPVARQEKRPVLVLMHCPGTTTSEDVGRQWLSPSQKLADLLRQFVTVNLTNGMDIDLERMPFVRYQDPDQSWWCWILSPQGQVYSVLGRDRPDAPKITEQEFATWLTRVLDHHWDPRHPRWNADGPVVSADTPERSILESPGFGRWRKGAEHLATLRNDGECLCCHQVRDVLWVEEDLNQQFRVTEDYWIWPPLATTGLKVTGETMPKVSDVAPGSFAARVRVPPDSTLGVVADRRIFSTTDVRAAVNSIEGPSGLKTYSALNGQVVPSTLGITQGAGRGYDLTWRTSIAESILAGHPGFLTTPVSAKLRNDLRRGNRLALTPEVAEGTLAWENGVRSSQVIIKSGEITRDLTPAQFLFLFKLNNQVGSLATLTVLRGEANWQPQQLTIPSISVLDVPPELLNPETE